MNLYKIALPAGFTPEELVLASNGVELSEWSLLPGGIFVLSGVRMGDSAVIVPYEGELYLMTSVLEFVLSVEGGVGSADVRVTVVDCSSSSPGADSSQESDDDTSRLTPGLIPGVIAGAIGSYLLFNKG